jgi:hypothetical protein
VLVAPAGLIRLRVGPAVLATTIHWLLRRNEASSATLLRRMAGPGAELPAELVTWTALVGRHVRTSLAPPPLPPLRSPRCGAPCGSFSAATTRSCPPNASSKR